MKPLLIFGVGQMAELVAHYATDSEDYKHIGFVTDRPESTTHLGLPLYGTQAVIR
ncbi:MAG: hypothetical protein ACKOAI_07815, partial [Acidimicrobiia bacterium]